MAVVKPTIITIPHLGNASAISDVGRVRKENEDNYLIDTKLGLLAVADGMGGHIGGAQASKIALDAIQAFLQAALYGEKTEPAPERLPDPDATWPDKTLPLIALAWDAIEFANERIYRQNLADGRAEARGMGTTLTGIWKPDADSPIVLFHVGDSRLYRLRDGQLDRISRDHTLYQQALELGATELMPAKNLLLQAIGPAAMVRPDIKVVETQAGDLLLLCSDGLHGALPEQLMTHIISMNTQQTCAELVQKLVHEANVCSGADNITLLCLELQ